MAEPAAPPVREDPPAPDNSPVPDSPPVPDNPALLDGHAADGRPDKAVLERIFGTEPRSSADEREPDGDHSRGRDDEDWFLTNRPPHHG